MLPHDLAFLSGRVLFRLHRVLAEAKSCRQMVAGVLELVEEARLRRGRGGLGEGREHLELLESLAGGRKTRLALTFVLLLSTHQ